MKEISLWEQKGGGDEGMKKRPVEKTLGGQINGRWEMKKGGRDRGATVRRRGGEGGQAGRRACAEPNHNWPDSGRWCGAVAGWNMCVWGLGGGMWRKCMQRSVMRWSL